MVEHPDPSPIELGDGVDGMPERTRRAFQSHADQQLDRVQETLSEIERVYRSDPTAVVSCSGGKDSMALLALADMADCDHRVFHWDWGSRLIPREIAQQLVDNIRQFVPDDRLYVASRGYAQVVRYPQADGFWHTLVHGDDISDSDGSLARQAGALRRADHVGIQILGLRSQESGKRARKLEQSGLFGESLDQPAAFPIREWSARDVWAFIVDWEIPYPDHYDRAATVIGNGGPRSYERARFTTFHDPEFEDLAGAVMGIAEWRTKNKLQKRR
ncbi:phosphoadenosine phosphosulfate reductase domain-containing protein [Halocatena halophila]|uniref:phosphoadenosine phosphosulfate reductase domain-containing protein n=1 Tax=Halocatena halophila TaxID=2814576 RepID=UPI002ED4E7FA